MSVSMQGGYTVVTPASDTRIVYVSSSQGSDSNNGLSASSPVRSIGAAKALLRDGVGDQMLLKKGDIWNEGLGYWKISGRSPDQPALIGAYGEGDRPEVRNSSGYAFGAGTPSNRLHDVIVQGVRMYAAQRDPNNPLYNKSVKASGVYLAGNIENLTFEDISVEYYTDNFVASTFYPYFKNLVIRKSNLSNAYSDWGSHSQGAYIEGVDGILLEGNTFDHNGWNEQIPSAGATIFNHNAYIQGISKNLVARGNIFANSSSHGLQARPGGIVEDNLFLNNPIGMSYGLVNGSGPLVPGGVTGKIANNVFVGGRNIGSQARGIGIELSNIKPGAGFMMEKNIFTQSYAGGVFAAINLSTNNNQNNGELAAGINDLTLKDNIVYKWQRGIWVDPALRSGGTGPYAVNNLNFLNNDFQEIKLTNVLYHGIAVKAGNETFAGNRYHLQNVGGAPVYMDGKGYDLGTWFNSYEATGQAVKANYVDPERDAKSYSATLGGAGTNEDFLAKARANRKDNFNPAYTASLANSYIRAGFVDRGDSSPAIPTDYVPPVSEVPPTIDTPVETPTPTPTPVEPTLPPPPPPPASNPTTETPTTSPGYHTVVGADGKIKVIWDNNAPVPTEPTPTEPVPEPEQNAPDVVYTQPSTPGTIVYAGGYWYIS
ncbi:right-handed parallel beta-helix repeat-containing protein [Humisphaera borealis]|uniref:Right handed beta helix domain-containing protein n=1 Tax=Humisphaera borealis TaxID=2807512 RepID=A0A7M2X0Y5_9BACT|nr:hypothetical protein [Humisphaera borealis]QOV91092.1 hypothetical protein IPV69_06965 [Humisphaera borealis]